MVSSSALPSPRPSCNCSPPPFQTPFHASASTASPSPAQMIELFVPLGLGAMIVCIAIGCAAYMCYGICHCCEHRREQREEEAVLRSCNKVCFTKRAKLQPCQNETCPICLEDFREREYVTVCPCRHGYHRHCLLEWLQTTPSCPICKSSVAETRDTERTPLLP